MQNLINSVVRGRAMLLVASLIAASVVLAGCHSAEQPEPNPKPKPETGKVTSNPSTGSKSE